MAEYKIGFRVAGAFGAQISFEAKPGVSYEDAAAALDKDKTKKDQPSNSACSECPDVSRLDLVCDVCGKPARIVAASAYGPISYAFCDECLEKGLEPYKGVVAYTACAGHFPDDINEEYRADIRRMLPLWGKTEEEFIKDVEKVIEEL